VRYSSDRRYTIELQSFVDIATTASHENGTYSMKVTPIETILKRVTTSGGFVHAVGIIVGATAFAQLLSVIISPLVTRLYSPEDYGVFAAYTAIVNILLAVNSLRYEFAIALPDRDDIAFNLVILCTLLVSITSILFAVGIWLLQDQIALWTNSTKIIPVLWVIPITLFGGGIYQALSFWAIRKKAFTTLARTKIIQSIGSSTLQITLGALQLGPLGLILSQLFAQAGGIFSLLQTILHRQLIPVRQIHWASLWDAAVIYRRFPFLSMWSSLLNTLGLNIPALLMLSLFGPATGGIFLFSQKIVLLPIQLIGMSTAQVFLGTAAELKRHKPKDFQSLFFKTQRRLFLIGIFPAIILALWAPPLFGVLFGPEWQLAGDFARFLSPAILMQFVTSPLSQAMIILERQDIQLAWDFGRLILIVTSFLLASILHWPPEMAVISYSTAMFTSYILLLLLLNRVVKRSVISKSIATDNDNIISTG